MPKASEIKRGAVVRYKDSVCVVRKLEQRAPSSRGANTLYKMKLQDVQSKQNFDDTFKGDDMFPEVDFLRRKSSYSYFDGEFYVFMDDEDYSQYSLNESDLEGQTAYLVEGLADIYVMLIEGVPVGIQLPPSVDLEIIETAGALKGGTVTKRNKPARLAGGLEAQVPEYLAEGEVVKVNTDTGEFMSRS